MAAVGKKGKKHKGKTFALTDFLADGSSSPGPGKIMLPRSRTWADEVENEDDNYYTSGRSKQPVVLPTAPREARSCRNVDEENIPRNPPFKAYIVNLHYDTHENDIIEFFANMKIVDVQLPRDDRGSGRLKGFGYIEFETRENLIAALALEETSIKGRRMRIEVSTNNDVGNNDRRYGGSDQRHEHREYDPERTQGDWRSGPREDPVLPSRPATFDRNNANIPNDRGAFTRDNMDGPLDRDRVCITRGDMEPPRDRNTFTRYVDTSSERGPFTRDNMGQSVSAKEYVSGTEGREFRSRYGSRQGNRDDAYRSGSYSNGYQERERYDGYDGDRERNRNYYHSDQDRVQRRNYNDARDPAEPERVFEVKLRPKLCLAQRTVPKIGETVEQPTSIQSAIFGGARPVDTAAREREIEESRPRYRQQFTRLENDEVDECEGTSELTVIFDGSIPVDSTGQDREFVEESRALDRRENCEGENDNKDETPENENMEQVTERSSIFGGATPVDSTLKYLDVEECLVKYGNESHKEKDKENSPEMKNLRVRSSIFGGATPVDTTVKYLDVEESLVKYGSKSRKEKEKEDSPEMESLRNIPERSSIFGGAKPVDTTAKLLEEEERLVKYGSESRKEKEKEDSPGMESLRNVPERSSIFGGAKPVDTTAKLLEVEERLVKYGSESRKEKEKEDSPGMESLRNVPERSSIFGGAKPVDTTAKLLEVEDRLVKYGSESRKEKEKEDSPGMESLRSSTFDEASPVDTTTKYLQAEEPLAKYERENNEKKKEEDEPLEMKHLRRVQERSSIFGGASPVDTTAKDLEVEERLAKQRAETRRRENDERKLAKGKKPPEGKTAALEVSKQLDIFGGARPLDSTTRYREVEQRVMKQREEPRRKVPHMIDEQQAKREEQQVEKKFEMAQPPAENVWLRRAAQHAANKEGVQPFGSTNNVQDHPQMTKQYTLMKK